MGYLDPIYAYGHPSTNCRAITGGAFYNPAIGQFPDEYDDVYFFTDVCAGWIRKYDPATDTASGFATGFSRIVDLEVSNNGELYYLSRGDPALVGKITYAGN
jgi:glucose/arabinose dehydrogenase